MTRTLAIETSCDDTSLAIVNFDGKTFHCEQMQAYSQISDHQRYWWVVPEIASRQHTEKIHAVFSSLDTTRSAIDCISVTTEPWLPWSLLVWKAFSSTLSHLYDKPLIQVNHIHGHIFSFLLERDVSLISFPAVVLSVSWGHNDLYLVSIKELEVDWEHHTAWHYHIYKLWWTIDDAAWEAFDKVSRMLWGPYPGGPWIWSMASKVDASPFGFNPPFLKSKDLLFSFSWLKSQVYYLLDQMKKNGEPITETTISQIAFSFEHATAEVLCSKAIQATQIYWAETIALVWGVSANTYLRELFHKKFTGSFYTPTSFSYCTDNAAMIWVAWLQEYLLQ